MSNAIFGWIGGTLVIVTLVWLWGAYSNGADKGMDGKYFTSKYVKLEAAIQADNRERVAQALAGDLDVNVRGMHGITPLMMAVDKLKACAVAELLAQGANPNLKADDGTCAMSLAVENYRQDPDILFALINGGGDPNARRPDDDPVLMRFVNDRNCDFIRQMKNLGADLDITTRGGDPIITEAALGCDWDVVWCLIELGAKYDYEQNANPHIISLSRSLDDNFPAPDSPIYPYKKKVWHFLQDHGIAVKPLR